MTRGQTNCRSRILRVSLPVTIRIPLRDENNTIPIVAQRTQVDVLLGEKIEELKSAGQSDDGSKTDGKQSESGKNVASRRQREPRSRASAYVTCTAWSGHNPLLAPETPPAANPSAADLFDANFSEGGSSSSTSAVRRVTEEAATPPQPPSLRGGLAMFAAPSGSGSARPRMGADRVDVAASTSSGATIRLGGTSLEAGKSVPTVDMVL